jgi:hypothetical protein
MRRRCGAVESSAGHERNDHLCWIYDGPAAWFDAAVPFLLDGVTNGERLLYVAGKEPDDLIADLAVLPDRDEMLASGQLAVMPMVDLNGPDGRFDPTRRIATIRTVVADALTAGYQGLRLAADVSSTVPDGLDPSAFAGYELPFDEMVSGNPLVVMCGYDRPLVPGAAAAMVCFVHPSWHRPMQDRGAGMYSDGAGGWHLVGALDMTNADQLLAALSAVSTGDDVHLRLDGLRFCDAASTRALITTAARLHPAARLVLHNPSDLMRRVLAVGWPGDNPGLTIVTDGDDPRDSR